MAHGGCRDIRRLFEQGASTAIDRSGGSAGNNDCQREMPQTPSGLSKLLKWVFPPNPPPFPGPILFQPGLQFRAKQKQKKKTPKFPPLPPKK